MGFATHLGPWLLGTVKETTGTTAGTIRNTGATIVAQAATVAMSGNALTSSAAAVQLFTIPAGAKILRFDVEVTVAVTGNSVSQIGMVVGSGSGSNNQLLTTFNTGTSVTKVAQSTVDAAMQVALTNNVGSTDYIVYGTFTATTGNPTAGSIVVTCEYVVRNSDGTSVPASA
jgi:hypothetical protein